MYQEPIEIGKQSEFLVCYNETIFRRANWHFWKRIIHFDLLSIFLLLLVVLCLLAWYQGLTWYIGLMFTFVLGVFLFLPSIYLLTLQRSSALLRMTSKPEILFAFYENGFIASSAMGTNKVRWEEVMEVWTFDDLWIIFLEKQIRFVLPTKTIDNGTISFLKQKIQNAGGLLV